MPTDWGGLLGTVVVAGAVTKMTNNLFGSTKRKSSKSKKSKKNCPW